jgi:hypothetical protein
MSAPSTGVRLAGRQLARTPYLSKSMDDAI